MPSWLLPRTGQARSEAPGEPSTLVMQTATVSARHDESRNLIGEVCSRQVGLTQPVRKGRGVDPEELLILEVHHGPIRGVERR